MNEQHGLDILWHSIGMKRSNYRRSLKWWLDNDNHRNNFCVNILPPIAGADRMAVLKLVDLGFMKPGAKINEGRDRYFHVTPEGIAYAKANFPRPAKKGVPR